MTLIKTVFIILLAVEQPQAKSSSCTCKNGGICMTYKDPNAGKSTYCECPKGFGGHLCELQKEECNGGSLFCFNGGTCEASNSDVQFEEDAVYICNCPEGMGGDYCEDKIDNCEGGLSCFNGGTCVNNTNANGFSPKICDCLPGFEGALCEIKAERCSDNLSCYNDGKCMLSNADAHYCICTPKFGGKSCEFPKVQCPGGLLSCLNGGKCVHEDPSNPNSIEKCSCPAGLGGSSCQIEVREKKVDDIPITKPESKTRTKRQQPNTGNDSSVAIRREILWTFFSLFVVASFFIGFVAVILIFQKQSQKSSSKSPSSSDLDVNIPPLQGESFLNDSLKTAHEAKSCRNEMPTINEHDYEETTDTVPIISTKNIEPTTPQIV